MADVDERLASVVAAGGFLAVLVSLRLLGQARRALCWQCQGRVAPKGASGRSKYQAPTSHDLALR